MASERGLPTITLWQPWASLIVPLRVKTIETRGWCAPERLIGARIGIHAAARPLRSKLTLGSWEAWPADPKATPHPNHPDGRPARLYSNDGALGGGWIDGARWVALPLGVLLGTARLVACVPMVDHDDWGGGDALILRPPFDRDGMGVANPPEVVEPWRLVSDQRPYGDFRPGRWAWLLDEITPTTEQCPACEGSGVLDLDGGGRCYDPDCTCQDCRVCAGRGRCDPIPAKGAQRVWYWQPEEADRGR